MSCPANNFVESFILVHCQGPDCATIRTKIIFTGDIHQIDTPYMDEQSNGLTYLIDKLKGNHLFAHIKLEKGEIVADKMVEKPMPQRGAL